MNVQVSTTCSSAHAKSKDMPKRITGLRGNGTNYLPTTEFQILISAEVIYLMS